MSEDVTQTPPPDEAQLDLPHRELLDDLFRQIVRYNPTFDRDMITRAFTVAVRKHKDQRRASGEDYILHPVGTATICADLRLDSPTVTAALLHDVVEDTDVSVAEVVAEFGEEVGLLVDGVTKLTQMSFRSVEEEQAENFRKMIIAMAKDIRVILIKLADRLHNMRTLSYLGKEKQIQKAKETLEIYAPLAHRLGIESVRWELEDLAFATLHPRKYSEIQHMVSQRRADREEYLEEARSYLKSELEKVKINAEILGRAKHFYSIYDKMTRKGKEFNEIYDLTAMRVLVASVRECYAALGIIHSLWKPLPGRFKDYIAMPKFNMYQSLHTTVIGPQGKPLEIQIRTSEMHETAEYGIAAHWIYKDKDRSKEREKDRIDRLAWLRQMMEWQSDTKDATEFMESLRIDLLQDEVYVFTPKGEVKSLAVGATPVDFAYAIHTDVGHRCVGAKANGRIVPLTYRLQSGDIVEILTTKNTQGPSRDWLNFVQTSGARNKIRQWFKRERREDSEHLGKEALLESFRKHGLPAQKLMGSDTLSQVMKDMNFQKREDFFVSIGAGKTSPQQVLTKVMQHMGQGTGAVKEELPPISILPSPRRLPTSADIGVRVEGIDDVAIRMPECCRPVPGDEIVGYISLGKGITIHRKDCPNVRALERHPERFAEVSWDQAVRAPFRVEIQVEAYDRSRLLEDISRTLSESGVNILAAHIQTTDDNTVKDRFVFEVPGVEYLDSVLQRIRMIDTVYDAYRVTPH
ncbi:MAG TPA: bifunctional (p)ppGpp synthetase/guanosine-3',5'-bis(diphosphate) 3'-pyrophosphohydrolase [Thermoleophilia bacterium]|nr:bifunctional (p)ppGpp synthetase/guanosine-3',5'-bis(diphosphate) 3'-pyrophosphohydrolase [Thermoleophilia bacterium]HZK48288.1 bifunctional (p)ppGpp synthetase/guanosine-3',5'-bis(diphosphate) 3'-pyrophosphohydrolase [Thermoleophilia bacterium]